MTLITIYALFGDDIRVLSTDKVIIKNNCLYFLKTINCFNYFKKRMVILFFTVLVVLL